MKLRCDGIGPDVVILSSDSAGIEPKSCFQVTRSRPSDPISNAGNTWLPGSRQEAQFFAALDGLGATGGSKLVEGAGTVCLDGVFGNEELGGDLTIAEAAGDQGEDLELACGDAESLLLDRIGSEGFERASFHGDEHFFDYNCFADGFTPACDAEADPDAEGGKENGNEGAVDLDRVLDDDEAVLGVLEDGNEEATGDTEDEDVALHDRVVKKYNGGGEEVDSRGREQKGEA